MKKTIIIPVCLLGIISFYSCLVRTKLADKQVILQKIYIEDKSKIGVLNYCNFSGRVENKNNYPITNLELKATFYNKKTYQRSFHTFKIEVPLTACGSATYSDKLFVGKRLEIEKVEVVHAEKVVN